MFISSKKNSIFVHFFSWVGFDGYYCIINCPKAKYLKGLDQNINYDLFEKRIKEFFGRGNV